MTNALFCTKCNNNRVLSNNDCICPPGGFTELIPAQISCATCSSLCASCQTGNPNFCTQCSGNRFLDNGLC